MKIAVIIPTYNERENIILLLDKLIGQKGFKNRDINYLVVDDNSPDGTQKAVKEYILTHPNVFLLTGKKEGLGKALLRGMKYTVENLKAQLLIQMDADLSHDPQVAPKLLEAIDAGADFAVGSRYIPGGSIPQNWGWHRKMYSRIGNMIVRFGLGYPKIHDWTGGFRAYKSIYYHKIHNELPQYNGYVFQIAFLHKSVAAGAKVKEVPFNFTDRKFGHSKIAPSEYIKNVLVYVIGNRIEALKKSTFSKFAVVGTIGFAINTVLLEIVVALGFHPAIGSIIGAECAIISNFIWNNSWTFSDRKLKKEIRIYKFIQFNLTSIGAVIIQTAAIWLGSIFSGTQLYRYYYVIGVVLGLIWNYFMYSRVIWKKIA